MGVVRRFETTVALLVALVGSVANAESSSGELPPPVGSPTTAAAVQNPNSPSLLLSVGPGLALYSGNNAKLYDSGSFGYGLNANVMGQLSEVPLYVGLDFAMDFWSFRNPPGSNLPAGTENDLSAVGVQFLPSALYRFDIPNSYGLHPYFGFSAGPNFMIFRKRTIDTAHSEVRSDSQTDVYFELLARPGLDYQFSENIAVGFEAKFGVLNWDFIFLPNVSAIVTL